MREPPDATHPPSELDNRLPHRLVLQVANDLVAIADCRDIGGRGVEERLEVVLLSTRQYRIDDLIQMQVAEEVGFIGPSTCGPAARSNKTLSKPDPVLIGSLYPQFAGRSHQPVGGSGGPHRLVKTLPCVGVAGRASRGF